MDWHEIAVGAIILLGTIGGWTWMRTVRQLDRIETRLDAHIKEDADAMDRIYSRMHEEIRALDARVDDRFLARDRARGLS